MAAPKNLSAGQIINQLRKAEVAPGERKECQASVPGAGGE